MKSELGGQQARFWLKSMKKNSERCTSAQDTREVLSRNRGLRFELDDLREELAALRAELAAAQVRT